MGELLRSPALDGLEIHGRLLVGAPAGKILELARLERPDLIVVGTHGARGLKHVLLGSVAEEIFRHAPCPVLTTGPKLRPRLPLEATVRTVLVPVDLSPESRQAVPIAANIAHEFGACLKFLHALPSEALSEVLTHQLAERISSQIHAEVGTFTPPSCRPDIVLEFGDEAQAIVRAAHDTHSDLIVMGLHRVSTAAGLRSSVTYRTILEADCPVLTIRPA
jgi:nucleotide-binding universal stress UspA family protein